MKMCLSGFPLYDSKISFKSLVKIKFFSCQSLYFSLFLVTTILKRFFSGLPILPKVLLPIKIVFPKVVCEKYFISAGIFQGSSLFLPIRQFLSIAQIRFIILLLCFHYNYYF